MRFICVDDGVPEATTRLLQQACTQRGLEYEQADPRWFDFAEESRADVGDMLYRPAISAAAARVEQWLYEPWVATFYADPDGPFIFLANAALLHERRGLPVPRQYAVTHGERQFLQRIVVALGGFPVVVKVPGGSGGIGVMRVDSHPALFSLIDHLLSQGLPASIMAYVEEAVHWRLIVVGERVVAAYRNTTERDDFRTFASEELADYSVPPSPEMCEVAVDSARALRLEFAGVDLLEHASGRVYLLESNFPCYFAQAQDVAGVDVAGAMLDHLQAKADVLLADSQRHLKG